MGFTGGIWTSEDGVSWKPMDTGGSQNFWTICRADGITVAAGTAGAIATTGWPVISPVTTAPALSIEPAAKLSVPTVDGRVYQPQSSPDNATWTDEGLPATGDGATLQFTRPVTGGKNFFRVVIK